MKTYEVIDQKGKSHYLSAKSKSDVLRFWVSQKPKCIIHRRDIHQKDNLIISKTINT